MVVKSPDNRKVDSSTMRSPDHRKVESSTSGHQTTERSIRRRPFLAADDLTFTQYGQHTSKKSYTNL